MKRLLEFPLDDGGSVTVEVDEPEAAFGMTRAARPGELAAKAGQTFESAIEKVKPAVKDIMTTLRDLNQPDEIEVEFGLKMTAEAGAIFAAAGMEANFKVTLKWERK